MSSGGPPSLRASIAAAIAVLAVCVLAAWLVHAVGCASFPNAPLMRSFCGPSMWSVAGPMLGGAAALLAAAVVAQRRGR